MTNRAGLLSLAFLLPLLTIVLLFHVSRVGSQAPENRDKLDEALQERLDEAPREATPFIVHLEARADLTHNLPATRAERRAAVVSRLLETANTSQQDLRSQLERLQAEGAVFTFRPLWIINAIVVEAQSHVPLLLAQRPDVARIALDSRQQYVSPPELQPQDAPPQKWNLELIRAQHAWHGLGVTGLGVTIAIMDTGVDWQHPDLRDNYRGLQDDGSVQHEGHWFDVIDQGPASVEPIDPNGHGTHVAGSAVGHSGTGVAPDAEWIAVRAFDSGGFASTGDLHVAFQWLLAPAGRPDLAPDIVNGSWSGSGQSGVFTGDLHALHQAGIVTVFAAGNNGPNPGTIGAPASYAGTIAVAAVDYRDEVTWFSARGPSPLTTRHKPELAAPGARIFSTLPGGTYGYYNGTSMAAPHVSGAAALILSANPNLEVQAVTRVLTETAHVTAPGLPDIHRGWGRLDVYAAVASQLTVGSVQGQVTDGVNPLPGATLTATTSNGASLTFATDDQGAYSAWLRPGEYVLQAAAFGYAASESLAVEVLAGGAANQNLQLTRLPHTTLSGRVRDASSDEPLAEAVITVAQAPVSATTDEQGNYTLALPSGATYTLYARHTGHRLGVLTETLEVDGPFVHDFDLEPAQTILLVDSGRWYYDSHVSYYRNALDGAGYAYDEWPVYSPSDTPAAETLGNYDVVIWTAPQDAPGWIGGGEALAAFLASGGNLLISGQNVARRDGVSPTAHSWWTQYLQARYLSSATAPFTLTGSTGMAFAGVNFALNTDDSAANQIDPARVAAESGALTRPLLTYDGDSEGASAAMQAGWCQPHRILFLGFGLEGVGPASVRAELMERALDHFAAPPVSRALALDPRQTNEVLLPGDVVTFTFTLQNLSEVQTTTIQLQYDSQWPTEISETSVRLGPCQQQPITLTLHVPTQLPGEARQAIELTALADYGAVAGASIVAQTPAPTLLVADYRWYDETGAYRAALEELKLSYDIWDTNARGSPSDERLAAYETVLWYTGYDWYAPLTPDEIDSLTSYLEQGGRLFLSSQDYLYYHRQTPFTKNFLGIEDYQETVTSTIVLGGDNALAGDGIGPFTLSYEPYQNFSDGIVPAPGSEIFVWDDWGFVAGVANQDAPWRSVFWSVPFELLPQDARTQLLGNIVGWLGDVGDSTVEVSPRIAVQPATRHYTLTLRNWQDAPTNQVVVTSTIPKGLLVDPFSVSGGAIYSPIGGEITWQGGIDPGTEHRITFRGVPDSSVRPGSRLNVTTTIAYEGQEFRWQRQTPIWTGAPDLGESALDVTPLVARPGLTVTYTAFLRNSSSIPADEVSATLTLPHGMRPVTETLWAPAGTISASGRHIRWYGSLAANTQISFTVVLSATGVVSERFLPAGLVIADGVSLSLVRSRTLHVTPYRWHFPLIQR